jgi:DNA-binding transcriptional ArsR family regulator
MDAFEALADPVRRELLTMLRRSPTAAGDLAAAFGISRPAISRHLRVLRDAGLARVEKHGRQRVYALEPAPLLQVDAWLQDFRDRWSPRLDALATEVHRTRRERRQSAGPSINDTAPSGEDKEQTS